jgi:hypothetical protein
MIQPSPYWGQEPIWTSKNNVHNPMYDDQGRVWITSAVRPSANPDFCKAGADHPSAKLYPLNNAGRHLAMYDPKTKQITHISTCFSTHHLMFAEDANHTLWTSGGGQVVGWLNTKMFEATHDEAKSQGWTALVMDTNGNGKRDALTSNPINRSIPRKTSGSEERSIRSRPRPTALSGDRCWFSGAAVRLVPGSNPPRPQSRKSTSRPSRTKAAVQGFSRAGWTSIATVSSGLRSRAGTWPASIAGKCKGPLNGPTATGQHCPEGWTLYAEPLPQLKGVTDPGSVGASYYTWVDQFDMPFGLGAILPSTRATPQRRCSC